MLYLLLIIASILVGFINTLAGSGSLIMLPLLMAAGLPANVANGTNRVAIVFQSLVGIYTFTRKRRVAWRGSEYIFVPSITGAILGAWLATVIDPKSLHQIIGVLMLLMLGVVLAKPERWLQDPANHTAPTHTVLSVFIMFVVGVYGGFIQASVGVLLLAALVLGARLPMYEANAYKLLVVAGYALPVLLVFVWQGQVDWFWGILTAAGQSLGAYLGARFSAQSPHANLWTYRVLVGVILLSLIQFYAPYFGLAR